MTAAVPDVMWDGQRWWEPCPFRAFRPHARKKWRLANLEGHASGDDGRCWLPASPEAFDRWGRVPELHSQMVLVP